MIQETSRQKNANRRQESKFWWPKRLIFDSKTASDRLGNRRRRAPLSADSEKWSYKRFRCPGGKLWPFYRRRVGIRAHREPLPPSGSGIRAPDRKSPSPAQGRPGRSADSELGPRWRFRSPGEEISTFYRSGAKIGVLVHTPRGGISGAGLGISRDRRLLDRHGETIPKSGHTSDSDTRAESYAHFFRRRGWEQSVRGGEIGHFRAHSFTTRGGAVGPRRRRPSTAEKGRF